MWEGSAASAIQPNRASDSYSNAGVEPLRRTMVPTLPMMTVVTALTKLTGLTKLPGPRTAARRCARCRGRHEPEPPGVPRCPETTAARRRAAAVRRLEQQARTRGRRGVAASLAEPQAR